MIDGGQECEIDELMGRLLDEDEPDRVPGDLLLLEEHCECMIHE